MGKARARYGSRHAPNDTRGLVLDKERAARPVDGSGALEAILAHPGEHNGEGAGSGDCARAAKKHIDGRSAGVFRRRVMKVSLQLGATEDELEVTATGGEIDPRTHDRFALGHLANRELSHLLQPVGQ